MFYIIGIIIAFFLALLLLGKKNKTLADKILFAWLMVIGMHLSLFVARSVSGNINFAFLLGIEIPFPLLHGPFLYLYTAAMTNQLPSKKNWASMHFIIPVLSLLMLLGFFMLPANEKVEIYRKKGAGYETQMSINHIAIYISGIFYVALCIMLLRKHRKNIEEQFSFTEKINLNWLRYLVYGIGFIWLIVITSSDFWVFGAVVVFILLLGFFGIKQVGIFTQTHQVKEHRMDPFSTTVSSVKETGNNLSNQTFNIENALHVSERPFISDITLNQPLTEEEDISIVRRKYAKSGLTDIEADRIHAELIKLMATSKIFTEPELTLTELATRLAIHANYLSQVVNEREGKNFYDYINSLRIEEFKNLVGLPENKKYTILTLAFECGFNSKSSFNRYFKKVTGLSPSEYIHN